MNTGETFVIIALLALSAGCTKKPEPEGYRVVSYDAVTHQWVILRSGTFDGKYLVKRITVVCSWYKSADHERVDGPEACNLQVGRMMIPNPFPGAGKRNEFLDVAEWASERLTIVEGAGVGRVEQQFDILKNEVLPDNPHR